MRRYSVLLVLVAAAALAVGVRHVHGRLTLQNDTVTLPVQIDDSAATLQLTTSLLDGGANTFSYTLQGTNDGTNWSTLSTARVDSATVTATGQYEVAVAGLTGVRVKATTQAADAGYIEVDWQPSLGEPRSVRPVSMAGGGVNILDGGVGSMLSCLPGRTCWQGIANDVNNASLRMASAVSGTTQYLDCVGVSASTASTVSITTGYGSTTCSTPDGGTDGLGSLTKKNYLPATSGDVSACIPLAVPVPVTANQDICCKVATGVGSCQVQGHYCAGSTCP